VTGTCADCANVIAGVMAIALLTNYLTDYRVPLFERLAERYGVEVLCFGGDARYVPSWFSDLDAQLERATFPARRIRGPREAFEAARSYEVVIAPYAGGAILPSAYAGARRHRRPFVLWASLWGQLRTPAHVLARPITNHIYRHADAVVAYGEHVRRFVASIRGRDDDVFVAPQSVEPELFGRPVTSGETKELRSRLGLSDGPLALYVGRLVEAKGVDVLLTAWRAVRADATLVAIGEGPLGPRAASTPGVRVVGPLPREQLPVAYAAAELTVLPSVATARFKEPWGLVCNESMHQGRPVIATDAVGAVAGGLVRDGETGLVVPSGDAARLAAAITLLLEDAPLRETLGDAARSAVSAYTYDAMADAFGRALATAGTARAPGGRSS
jgi:glycosyltransferase involved in cell wall biosynthesis